MDILTNVDCLYTLLLATGQFLIALNGQNSSYMTQKLQRILGRRHKLWKTAQFVIDGEGGIMALDSNKK